MDLANGQSVMEGWQGLVGDGTRSEMTNQNEDAMVACWLAYLIYCNAGNECYLLREEKKAITIVLRHGRRLDP